MKTAAKKRKAPASVDAYLAGFPARVRGPLETLRRAIHRAAPGVQESISYGIPTFTLGRQRVHLAGYEHHVGFYPGAEPIEAFAEDLSEYELGRGTVRFPLGERLPLRLFARMVKFGLGLE